MKNKQEYALQKLKNDKGMHMITGGLSGMAALTVTHPLERIKMMRIFRVREIAGQNLLRSIITVLKTKGIFSLYRGNRVSCIREFPCSGLMFFLYETFKSKLAFCPNWEPELSHRICSGAAAGIIANTVTYPLDPIKALISSDLNGELGGIYKVCKSIYYRSGIAGFYHGWTATMCSVTPYIALNMTCFDLLKKAFGVATNSPYFTTVNLMCGSFSGTICWCIIFPIESVRRRMQASGKASYVESYKGIFDCVTKTYSKHGFRGFYFGLPPACCKVFISAGVMFSTNEKLKSFFYNTFD